MSDRALRGLDELHERSQQLADEIGVASVSIMVFEDALSILRRVYSQIADPTGEIQFERRYQRQMMRHRRRVRQGR